MARTPPNKKKTGEGAKPKKAGGRSRKKNETTPLEALQKNTQATRAKYTNAEKTAQAYAGYMARGHGILADIITERRKKIVENPAWVCDQGIDTELLAKAFQKPPNKYSAVALELYITQKCVVEGLGKSTCEGIHGAFAKYWDTMDGDKYAGEYHYDETTEKVTGCPARAGIVQSLVKVIKVRAVEKGAAATRNHAEAMSAEDMASMMDWSTSTFPSSKLTEAVKTGVAPDDPATLILVIKHALMQAFSSSGFNLWPRNFELCGLQMQNLTLGCMGPLPQQHPYFKVFLDGRKGWQHKQGYDSTRESNEYNIYSQPDLPALDMYKYLLKWLAIYELCIGCKLEDDDYIFPYIAPNGTIHPKREMTLQMCQDLITEFTESAGLKKSYTTHSFRRGGAQYRFMFAPLGKRWSLSIIRWWGGWASGEHVDTLMKYLLDSLQSYETSHGDALCPVPREADKSFMGDHLRVAPVATEEFRTVTSRIMTRIEEMSLNPTCCSHSSRNTKSVTPPSQSGPVQALPTTPGTDPTANTSQLQRGGQPIQPPRDESTASPTVPTIPMSQRKSIIPGVVIPDLKKGDLAWREAVRQWEEGDLLKGLKPLRDWPKEWYSDGMRLVTGTKRSQRKLVFDEYERLNRDDSAFIDAYPAAHKRIKTLLSAIRENNKARGVAYARRSKKGNTS
ncbi:hypothetical protein DFH09DRAFT_945625 [Mycena vulgaris]|nr:hypothetical protein DFH09DRAFT_945625 [Mycena vulgaris]